MRTIASAAGSGVSAPAAGVQESTNPADLDDNVAAVEQRGGR
jgi:hypothetical protein